MIQSHNFVNLKLRFGSVFFLLCFEKNVFAGGPPNITLVIIKVFAGRPPNVTLVIMESSQAVLLMDRLPKSFFFLAGLIPPAKIIDFHWPFVSDGPFIRQRKLVLTASKN